MKAILSFLALMILNSSGFPQSEWRIPKQADYPNIRKKGTSIERFVPKDFVIMKSAKGDLNGDSLEDVALVIKGTLPKFMNSNNGLGENIYDTNLRILLVLLRQNPRSDFRLAARNNDFIIPPPSPVNSEPFQDIAISRGILQIKMELWQSAGSWSASNTKYRFRLQKGEFLLIGVEQEEYMRNSVETTVSSYNFLAKRVKKTEGIRETVENYSAEYRTPRIRWKLLPNIKRKTLRSIGPAFSWEIEPDLFI